MKKIRMITMFSILMLGLVGCSGMNRGNINDVKEHTSVEFMEFLLFDKHTDVEKIVEYIDYYGYSSSSQMTEEEYNEMIKESAKLDMNYLNEVQRFPNTQLVEMDSYEIAGTPIHQIRVENLFDEPIIMQIAERDGKYKWRIGSSFGSNSKSILMFKNEDRFEETLFRFNAELDDYYNFSFRGKDDDYYSIKLNEPNTFNEYIHGYVRRDSYEGEKLYNLLKYGKTVPITVTIQYPSGAAANEETVYIKEFVSDTWGYEILDKELYIRLFEDTDVLTNEKLIEMVKESIHLDTKQETKEYEDRLAQEIEDFRAKIFRTYPDEQGDISSVIYNQKRIYELAQEALKVTTNSYKEKVKDKLETIEMYVEKNLLELGLDTN